MPIDTQSAFLFINLMGKPFLYLCCVLISIASMTSCRDTPEKVTRNFIKQYDELSLILNKTSNDELSSYEAVEKIEAWKKQLDKLMNRRDDLYQGDPYKDDYGAYLDEIDSSTLLDHRERLDVCVKAMHNLRMSGKFTAILESTITDKDFKGTVLGYLWEVSGKGITPAHHNPYSTISSETSAEVESEDIPEAVTSELQKSTNKNE